MNVKQSKTAFLSEQTPDDEAVLGRLSAAVTARINRSRTLRLHERIIAHSLIAIAALAAFVPAVRDLSMGLAGSGFSAYASLAVSDSGYLLTSWKDILLSLLESLPIVNSIAVVGLILIFVNALRRDARYLSSLSGRKHAVTA